MNSTVTFPPVKVALEVETYLDEEWYVDTYITDDDDTCTLFVRRFIVRRGTTGRVWCKVENSARSYQTIAGLLEDIAAKRMKVLPPEAESDLDLIPGEILALIDNLRSLR